MKPKLYFKGSVVQVSFKQSMPKETRIYMLVESTQQNVVFQLICIMGGKPGTIYGEILEDEIAAKMNCIAVTKNHLIKELVRNRGPYYKTSLKIYDANSYRMKYEPGYSEAVHKNKEKWKKR